MRYSIYCDEASTTGAQFMLIGGLWVPQDRETTIRRTFKEIRTRYRLDAEMKWTKVSRTKLPAYKAFLDTFWLYPELSFNCIVVDTYILDHKTYNRGDEELGFYKFYHLVVRHNLNFRNLYWLYTDERHNRKSYRLSTLRLTTNNWWKKKAHVEPLRNIEPRSSKDEDFIQLADILLGAIAYEWNGYSSSVPKLELARYIADRSGKKSLRSAGGRGAKVNIWEWKPSENSRGKGNPRPGP